MFNCLWLDISRFHDDKTDRGAELAGLMYLSSSQNSSWGFICEK